MLDFETIYQKRGESYIIDLLSLWERSSCVKHSPIATLEERWGHFIRATEPTSVAA